MENILIRKISLLILLYAFIINCSCTKKEDEAKVLINGVTDITTTSVKVAGEILDLGPGITDHGHIWSLIENPTIADSKTSLGPITNTGTFQSTIDGLTSNTIYFVRAYVIAGNKTIYSPTTIKFTTPGEGPVSDFKAAPTIISMGESVLFSDQSTGSPTSWNWSFGDGTISTDQNPVHAYSTPGKYSVILTTTNSFGTDIEIKNEFITVNGSPPMAAFTASQTTISTGQNVMFSDQSTNSPTSWSWIFGDGGTSNSSNPSHIYTSSGIYTVILTVTNQFGSNSETKVNYITVNIGDIIFNPNLSYGSVTDIDGNNYRTIQIGNQLWMAENLKTTRFNDGTDIPLVINGITWTQLTTPAYGWYDNYKEKYEAAFGALYNGYVIDIMSNGNKNVCPVDWHVPTDDDWTSLTTFLGGEDIAAEKLKETGNTHWTGPDAGGTNESGFTALPGGTHSNSYYEGLFTGIGLVGQWWSSTNYDLIPPLWYRAMDSGSTLIRDNVNKKLGISVRCIKD